MAVVVILKVMVMTGGGHSGSGRDGGGCGCNVVKVRVWNGPWANTAYWAIHWSGSASSILQSSMVQAQCCPQWPGFSHINYQSLISTVSHRQGNRPV